MGPHGKHFYGTVLFHNLIDQPVLYVNTAGVGARKTTDQLLEWRRLSKWILSQNVQQRFRTGSPARFLCTLINRKLNEPL
jgi:hypothetical protein